MSPTGKIVRIKLIRLGEHVVAMHFSPMLGHAPQLILRLQALDELRAVHSISPTALGFRTGSSLAKGIAAVGVELERHRRRLRLNAKLVYFTVDPRLERAVELLNGHR